MPEINSSSLPVNLPAQEIGPNDLISVSVYDSPELTRAIRVGSDGLLRFPMLQTRIQAQGLQPAELEKTIAGALVAEKLIVEPLVTVSVLEYASRPINVSGAVKRPVTFQAAGPVTLLDAIARAEGLTLEAGADILVSRAGSAHRIPVKELMDGASPELNLKLDGGEEIRVPPAGKVFVVGNVHKPGAFPVQTAGDTTVLKMLAMAEGLMPYASKQAYIYRQDSGSGAKTEIPIELRKIMERKAPDVALTENDIFYVPDASGRRAAMSAIERALSFGSTAGATALIYRNR